MVAFEEFVKALIALFIIMDPFASLPHFMEITKKASRKEKVGAATTAAGVSGGVLAVFTIFGPTLLGVLHITMQDFKIAGGVLLFIMAVQTAFGTGFASKKKTDVHVAVVVIAVPLITGPGALTTAIILAEESGTMTVIAAILLVTAATWIILRFSEMIQKVLGERGIEIVSRMMGLLLGGIAVSIIRSGLGF